MEEHNVELKEEMLSQFALIQEIVNKEFSEYQNIIKVSASHATTLGTNEKFLNLSLTIGNSRSETIRHYDMDETWVRAQLQTIIDHYAFHTIIDKHIPAEAG